MCVYRNVKTKTKESGESGSLKEIATQLNFEGVSPSRKELKRGKAEGREIDEDYIPEEVKKDVEGMDDYDSVEIDPKKPAKKQRRGRKPKPKVMGEEIKIRVKRRKLIEKEEDDDEEYFYSDYAPGEKKKVVQAVEQFLEKCYIEGKIPPSKFDKGKQFILDNKLDKPNSHRIILKHKLEESMMNKLEEKEKDNFKVFLSLYNEMLDSCYIPKPMILESLFFPSTESERKLANTIKKAKKSLDICIFTFTNNKLRDAVIHCHQKGVKVRIIADDACAEFLGADIHELASLGIPTTMDNDPNINMHNKFVILDKLVLITGSFNWTVQAVKKNQENLIIMENPSLILKYQEAFNSLWAQFSPNMISVAEGKKHMAKEQEKRAKMAKERKTRAQAKKK